jgi:hypothetical protein
MPSEKRSKLQLQKGRDKVAKHTFDITNFFGNNKQVESTRPDEIYVRLTDVSLITQELTGMHHV